MDEMDEVSPSVTNVVADHKLNFQSRADLIGLYD